jgi:hypothetical protein
MQVESLGCLAVPYAELRGHQHLLTAEETPTPTHLPSSREARCRRQIRASDPLQKQLPVPCEDGLLSDSTRRSSSTVPQCRCKGSRRLRCRRLSRQASATERRQAARLPERAFLSSGLSFLFAWHKSGVVGFRPLEAGQAIVSLGLCYHLRTPAEQVPPSPCLGAGSRSRLIERVLRSCRRLVR